MSADEQPYAAWLGGSEAVQDWIAPAPVQAAAATFDDVETEFRPGSAVPPLWHWFYFLPKAPQSQIGADGHPARGGFLPPIPLPRRMFAGARLTFSSPLIVGRPAERRGTIRAISERSGRSGSLVFVTVGYTISQDGCTCIEEEQDIVYRDADQTPVPPPEAIDLPPATGALVRTITPDPVLLFRFSSLTFNGHRIHYDRPYATSVEGYPGLIVHGPLTAVLLLELVRRNVGRPVRAFRFRGLLPLFDLTPFRVAGTETGDTVTLEALRCDGKPAMEAEATLAAG
ncbi:MAG: acyl-CoA dehydrogenase [Defluviicoccus sp.]